MSRQRKPQMSGWCGNPSETDGVSSHTRCTGGNRANPAKEFQPCPCSCHLGDETYECANCPGWLAEAPVWENDDPDDVDENGDPNPVYVHVDENFRAIGRECVR